MHKSAEILASVPAPLSLPDLGTENKDLQVVRDKLKCLREKYDPIVLQRDIRHLQNSSRIQNLRPEIRDVLLKELQRRKLIHEIVCGEDL